MKIRRTTNCSSSLSDVAAPNSVRVVLPIVEESEEVASSDPAAPTTSTSRAEEARNVRPR